MRDWFPNSSCVLGSHPRLAGFAGHLTGLWKVDVRWNDAASTRYVINLQTVRATHPWIGGMGNGGLSNETAPAL